MKEFKVGSNVIVDNKYICKIIYIVKEDNKIFYEVKPLEFDSFTRFVKEEQLKIYK